jgi:hypothetical protein
MSGTMTATGNLAFLHAEVTREERGWFGHYVCAYRCLFRRNTLLTCGNVRLVVSTVGAMRGFEYRIEPIGHERYYETMVFHADPEDLRYHDADIHRPVRVQGKTYIGEPDADDRANAMHEAIVAEMTKWLRRGGGQAGM